MIEHQLIPTLILIGFKQSHLRSELFMLHKMSIILAEEGIYFTPWMLRIPYDHITKEELFKQLKELL